MDRLDPVLPSHCCCWCFDPDADICHGAASMERMVPKYLKLNFLEPFTSFSHLLFFAVSYDNDLSKLVSILCV